MSIITYLQFKAVGFILKKQEGKSIKAQRLECKHYTSQSYFKLAEQKEWQDTFVSYIPRSSF